MAVTGKEYGRSPFGSGTPMTDEEMKKRQEAARNGYTFTSRLRGGAKGAFTGYMATGSPAGAIAGGGAGFVAPGLTGEQTEGQKNGTGGGMGDDSNMASVRARIEELRRQQYAQRSANLEKVMGFFGPVNAELKSIYGVDMPTWSSGPSPFGPSPEQRGQTLGQNVYDAAKNIAGKLPGIGGTSSPPPDVGIFDPVKGNGSPFAKPPQPKVNFVSRLRNPKAMASQDPTAPIPGTDQPWKRRYG